MDEEAFDDEDALEAMRSLDVEAVIPSLPVAAATSSSSATTGVSAQRTEAFKEALSELLFSSDGRLAEMDAIPLDELLPVMNEGRRTQDLFDSNEARQVLEQMHRENSIMFSEDMVFKL